jgi:hypothetical protein
MSCRIWVATEGMIYCAYPVFMYMCSKTEFSESGARSLKTGSLYSDKPPLRLERWIFWKQRFSYLAAEAIPRQLGGSVRERISDALKSMDAGESLKD